MIIKTLLFTEKKISILGNKDMELLKRLNYPNRALLEQEFIHAYSHKDFKRSIWKTNQDELRDQMRNSKNLFMVKFILGVWSSSIEKLWVQQVPPKSSVYYQL